MSDYDWMLGDKTGPHQVTIEPSGQVAFQSGRTRYRVVCWACRVVVHEATTGPVSALREHFKGEPGYERPLREEELAQANDYPKIALEVRAEPTAPGVDGGPP